MKRCYLIRHAQTVWNGENRLQGHSDLPLSPLGYEQAKQLGQYFAHFPVTRIATSALQRSRQTAQAIAEASGKGLSPLVDNALAEMSLGAWEGLTPQEIDAQFDGAYHQWRHSPASVTIPGAEAPRLFRERVRQALKRLFTDTDGEELVVVSHGGVIAAFLADMMGTDYTLILGRIRLDNAGITALEVCEGGAEILWINSTSHLNK